MRQAVKTARVRRQKTRGRSTRSSESHYSVARTRPAYSRKLARRLAPGNNKLCRTQRIAAKRPDGAFCQPSIANRFGGGHGNESLRAHGNCQSPLHRQAEMFLRARLQNRPALRKAASFSRAWIAAVALPRLNC